MKDIDDFRIKILTALILLWSINAYNVSGQPFFGEAETNKLLKLLDPGRAADLIVVPVESERSSQLCADLNFGDDCLPLPFVAFAKQVNRKSNAEDG